MSVVHSTVAVVLVRDVKLLFVFENTEESALSSAEITNDVPATLKPSEVKRRLALTMVAPCGMFKSVKRRPDVTVLVPLLKTRSLALVVTAPSISWAS